MPVFELTEVRKEVPELAVVGKFSGNPADFVCHVALHRTSRKLAAGEETEVWHMGPPVIAGELTAHAEPDVKGRSRAQVAAYVELPAGMQKRMQTWLVDVDQELSGISRSGQYIVHPPVKREIDPESKRGFRRFSCAGFVAECYRAGLRAPLVSTDEDDLPEVSPTLVYVAYDERLRHNDKLRRKVGLAEGKEWRILLAGYLLHALERPLAQIIEETYKPAHIGNAFFPRREPADVIDEPA